MKLLSIKVDKSGLVLGEMQDAYRDPQWDVTLFKFIGRSPTDLRVSMRVNRQARHIWRTLRPDERPDVRTAIASEVEKALNQYKNK